MTLLRSEANREQLLVGLAVIAILSTQILVYAWLAPFVARGFGLHTDDPLLPILAVGLTLTAVLLGSLVYWFQLKHRKTAEQRRTLAGIWRFSFAVVVADELLIWVAKHWLHDVALATGVVAFLLLLASVWLAIRVRQAAKRDEHPVDRARAASRDTKRTLRSTSHLILFLSREEETKDINRLLCLALPSADQFPFAADSSLWGDLDSDVGPVCRPFKAGKAPVTSARN